MQSDPHKAIDFILKNSGEYAKAKAQRVYLEQFRSSKKALLMAESKLEAVNAREQYAYAHSEYVELLAGLKEAVEREESLKWKLIAAQTRVDVWRSEEASNRRTDGAVR